MTLVSAGLTGFEVGRGIANEFREKGYAVEVARASIDWSFATYELERIISASTRKTSRHRQWNGGWRRRARRDLRPIWPRCGCLADAREKWQASKAPAN